MNDTKVAQSSTDIVGWETIDFGDGTTNMCGSLKSDPRVSFSLFQGMREGELVWGGSVTLLDSILVRTKATEPTMQAASVALEERFKEWCERAVYEPKPEKDENSSVLLKLTGKLAQIKYVDRLNRMFMLHQVFQPHMFRSIAFLPEEFIRPIMDLVVESGHGKLNKGIYFPDVWGVACYKDIDWDDTTLIEMLDEETGEMITITNYSSEIILVLTEAVKIQFEKPFVEVDLQPSTQLPRRSTGLIDYNGQEIFEGDIVRGYWSEDLQPQVVVWQAPAFVMKTGRNAKAWSTFDISTNDKQTVVVVGNIFSHPELLDSKKK